MSFAYRSRGFTLVELLVAIAVVGLLMGLLFPAVQSARESARTAECRSNLHQFGVDLFRMSDTHGRIPAMFSPGAEDDPRVDLLCPSFVGEYPDQLMHSLCYYQGVYDATREQVVERLDAPSVRIVLVHDSSYVHAAGRQALFLDGHVRSLCAEDVGVVGQ